VRDALPLGLRRRGGIVLERSLYVADGMVMLRQRLTGNDTRIVVTHDSALRSVVEVRHGRMVIPLPSGDVATPARFVLAVPPRSIIPMRFEHAEIISEGGCATRALDGHATPVIEAVASWREAREAIASTGPIVARLDPDAGVASSLVYARQALHAAVAEPAPVRVAATAVGIAPETLVRQFADVYRITPKQYCQRARLFDAAVFLFEGVSVLDAALRAGFNDLTRFYTQFRRLLGGTPGEYARIRKRQDVAASAG
jgi:methylphosphotriester-DNA--protein-cysteine methyltransferase